MPRQALSHHLEGLLDWIIPHQVQR